MLSNSRQNILKLGISFLLLFVLFFLIGYYPNSISFELKKANVPIVEVLSDSSSKSTSSQEIISNAITINDSSIFDTVKLLVKNKVENKLPTDTSNKVNVSQDSSYKEKILLIGDSQLEGLRDPIYGYCVGNNCKLSATVLWYGSSTKEWGQTDTLDYFIRKFKPTFVLFAIGLNELFVNDLENRKMYIDKILNKFKKFNVKYFWIGPAAWTKDKGVIEIMQAQVGKLFYPSHLLTLTRADDKRHPSRNAAKIWFDSVAVYMSKTAEIDFSKKTIALPKVKDTPMIVLSQVKY